MPKIHGSALPFLEARARVLSGKMQLVPPEW